MLAKIFHRLRFKKLRPNDEVAHVAAQEELPPPLPRSIISPSSQDARPLLKLADASKVQGASGAQNRSVQVVLEDASTGATQQFAAAAVELRKKSTVEIPPPLPPHISSTTKAVSTPSALRTRLQTVQQLMLAFFKKNISSDRSQQLKTFLSKAQYQITSMKKVSPTRDLIVLRPAEAAGEWQLWKFPFKKTDSEQAAPTSEKELTPILLEDHAIPPLPSNKTRLVVGVPTCDLIVIPLWISSEGNRNELIELELASKHLLRRGMSEGLKTIPLETKEGRTLVIVLAPTISPSSATAAYLKHADQFEAAARLLPQQGADLLIWRELGEICFGFSKNGQCIWFSGSSETTINTAVIGLIKRMALRLQAESILETMPRSVRAIGSFSEEELSHLKNALTTFSSCDYLPLLPSPLLPTPALDLPDEAARNERLSQEKKLRIKRFATLASLIYFFLLLLAGSNLLIKKSTLHYLNHRVMMDKPNIDQANQIITQWQEFRPAIDPTVYALDQLAAIARQIHGEKIRIITLAGIEGHLQLTGEATDVAQAYHFIEQIKKAPELQEYQWTSGQPKLAGKNSVRFELEGSRPNAKTSTE